MSAGFAKFKCSREVFWRDAQPRPGRVVTDVFGFGGETILTCVTVRLAAATMLSFALQSPPDLS